jgi:hypothetical protein
VYICFSDATVAILRLRNGFWWETGAVHVLVGLSDDKEKARSWLGWQSVELKWTTSKEQDGHTYLNRLALDKWFYLLTVTVMQL